MHAKHSRQQPIIEGLVLGLRVVLKFTGWQNVTPHMDPEYSHQGVSSALLSSYRILCVLGTRRERRTIRAARDSPWWYGEQQAESALEESEPGLQWIRPEKPLRSVLIFRSQRHTAAFACLMPAPCILPKLLCTPSSVQILLACQRGISGCPRDWRL